ncbi:MAG: hypothetical protein U9Q03_05060 [Patescibacteria group bacterium]|nr:hypothetical protein [Patescibacteria group bacterium]
MKIFNRKIRRRQLKRFGWIVISVCAVLSMIVFTVAPGLSMF